MKKHTSMANITRYYSKVFRCGYCDLQYIMRLRPADYYNAGVYGWNCDIYTFGDIAITTGYRNMRGLLIPEEIIRKYSDIAKEICNTPFGTDYTALRNALEENAERFIAEIETLL